MDWIQVLVILCVIGGDFLFLTFKIDFLRKDLIREIRKNREDIVWIKYELGHRPSKEPKEN